MFTTDDILEIAVRIETNGEQAYRAAARQAADPFLAGQLATLADDEQKHRLWFADLQVRLAVQPVEPGVAELGRELFQSVFGEKAFSLDEVDLARLPDMQALLTVSMELERDTIAFYEMLEPFMGDERGRQDLATVIEEERKHLRLLQERTGREGSPS
jgi:rubrerythrin